MPASVVLVKLDKPSTAAGRSSTRSPSSRRPLLLWAFLPGQHRGVATRILRSRPSETLGRATRRLRLACTPTWPRTCGTCTARRRSAGLGPPLAEGGVIPYGGVIAILIVVCRASPSDSRLLAPTPSAYPSLQCGPATRVCTARPWEATPWPAMPPSTRIRPVLALRLLFALSAAASWESSPTALPLRSLLRRPPCSPSRFSMLLLRPRRRRPAAAHLAHLPRRLRRVN